MKYIGVSVTAVRVWMSALAIGLFLDFSAFLSSTIGLHNVLVARPKYEVIIIIRTERVPVKLVVASII